MRGRRLLFPLALALLVASPVVAQTTPGQAPISACQGDVKRFCSTVQPGEGRIVKCLREHARELSPECRQAARAARQSGQASPPR